MDDETVYYWLHCQTCGKYHRGDPVRSTANRVNMPIDTEFQCPDTSMARPEKYLASDQVPATAEQIRHYKVPR